jgi:tetratricopeptide (TPR) repeat protein
MRSKFFIKTLALISLLISTTAWSLESSDTQIRSAFDPNSMSDINKPVENNAVIDQKPRTSKWSRAAKRRYEKDVPQQNAVVTADPQAIIIEDKAASNKALEMEAHLKQLEEQINKLQNVQVVQQNTNKVAEQTAPPLDQQKAVLQPYYFPAIAFITGIASLLGWQKLRKRNIKDSSTSESLAITAKSSTPLKPVETIPIPDIKTETTLDFLAELNSLNANQNAVNLLTEVDIYISHGYYQKAEELLRRAIQQQPIRDEYKLKLLKTYYTSGNKIQFANYINELDHTGKLKEHPLWNNIADMVKVLIPDSPLLTPHKPPISEKKQQDLNERLAQETLDDELEFNFDFSEPPVAKKYKR